MPVHSLRELQLGVMRAVHDGEPDLAVPHIASPAAAARHALSVYANTARGNFTEGLILSFPVLRRLVGEDYFRQVSLGFHARHPSLSGDLQLAGAGLAQYLVHLHGDGEYRYLGEVARLEWLIQETLLAADHPPFDLAKLQMIAPEDYDDLRFRLHPSVRLFASEFPCAEIWEANAEAEPQVIDLRTGPDRLLTIRIHGELAFHRLSSNEFGFLESLRAQERFAAAIACGTENAGKSDVERNSQNIFNAIDKLKLHLRADLVGNVL